MGRKVRYDGGHLRSRICMEHLDEYCDWVPTCPEMAIGMPSPRPTIHLVHENNRIKLLNVKDHSIDYTEKMENFAEERISHLSDLCGYVVAKNSPSCGMERVKLWQDVKRDGGFKTELRDRDGVGVFTRLLMERYPNMPVEEDGRLNDARLRDNFIARIFTYHHWLNLVEEGITYHALYQFHARVKYALMACDVNVYRSLGRFLADSNTSGTKDSSEVAEQYISELMAALKCVAKPRAHHNTLLHIMGYFKNDLSSLERQNLRKVIDDYYQEIVPLGVPINIIRLYLKKYPNDYLSNQFYLFPYPRELATRDFL